MEMIIDVLDNGAVSLLKEMEQKHLIRLQPQAKKGSNLAERFAGSLHLSESEYHDFQRYLTDSRNEWERTI